MRDVKHEDIIELTWEEGLMGAMAGSMRRISHAKKPSLRNDTGEVADDWNIDIDGAQAEIAFAKRCNLLWVPGAAGKCDFGGGIEVRSTIKHDNRMIFRVRDTEKEGWKKKRYVLVTGRFPTLWVRGWIRGEDAAQDKWWQDVGNGRPPAWFIPVSALLPISTIVLNDAPRADPQF